MSNGTIKRIQAAIVVTPADNAAKVANVVMALKAYKSLDLTIIRSFTDIVLGAPATDIPASGFNDEQFIKYSQGEIKKFNNKIFEALHKLLDENTKPEISWFEGSLSQIVSGLVSMFEVVVMPRSLELLTRFRLWRPALDSLIMKSKKVPILFYVDASVCRKIIVAQVGTSVSFQDVK